MSVMDRVRDWMDRREGLVTGGAAGPPGPAAAEPDEELARRRDFLAGEVAATQFDLGGLVYEMAVRDHFRPDVLVRRSARLQELDAELGEVERLLQLRDGGASGTCRGCGALHSRGAVFCWQCGSRLLEAAEMPA